LGVECRAGPRRLPCLAPGSLGHFTRVGTQPIRRQAITLFLITVAATAAAWLSPSLPARAVAGRPNIVVIQADDQNLDQARARFMPNLDRLLRRRGTEFRGYYVSTPLCCPSRATLLSGRYPHNHGVLTNDPGFPLFDQSAAVNLWLQRAGYRTALIGKYLNFYGVRDPTEVPRGWDEWDSPPGPSTYLMYRYYLNRNGRLSFHGSQRSDYKTDVYRRLARRYIARSSGQAPFFLYVNPLAPHDENDSVQPPKCHGARPAPRDRHRFDQLRMRKTPSYDERDISDKPRWVRRQPRFSRGTTKEIRCSYRRTRRSLLAVDDLVAATVKALRHAGELSRTYIFYTSDNGFLEGQHRLAEKAAPYRESTQVPLLVRGPGISRGSTTRQLGANIDLAPTFLDIANARGQATEPLDGISLLPYLHGRAPRRHGYVLLESFDPHKYHPYRGLQGVRYTYIRYPGAGRKQTELYDLARDPFELENVAGERRYRRVQSRLRQELRRRQDCSGRSCHRMR
jgi:N-acetylglucosamine-6-sulfatase